MIESRQGSTQRHDFKPTEIGRRRALALANPILVVWCASHLLLSVAYIRQRVRGEQHILRGEAKIVLTLTLTLFLALKVKGNCSYHSYQDNVLQYCMRHCICRMRLHAIAAIANLKNSIRYDCLNVRKIRVSPVGLKTCFFTTVASGFFVEIS